MKKLIISFLSIFAALHVWGGVTTSFKISDSALTEQELLKGDIMVALRIYTSSKDMYIGESKNTSFDSMTGSTIFKVEKAGKGICLKNIKTNEYLASKGNKIMRSTKKKEAQIFTPVKITKKVDNTHANADETRSYWLTFQYDNTTYYLNTNTTNHEMPQYATGNGNWSTLYIYKVEKEEITTTPIIPAPKKVTSMKGTLKEWSWDNIAESIDNSMAEEAYTLSISRKGISIKAGSEKGIFYARQSLTQLEEQSHTLPCMVIEDEPRFGYRGFMLDVSRHFFSVDEIKKILDVMARYKMNVFHWHLTDDQGWRAEIKRYPKLTTISATRSDNYDTPIHKVVENGQTYWTGTGMKTGQTYGPYFYTQDEMREVVAYAAERQIDVLPEVDMPGHFVAALAAYPEYCCHPETTPAVWSGWGVSRDVLNVANPQAVAFAQNILSELCDIFPYPYIHIGGDECPTEQWETNKLCQARYKELGLSSYRPLQSRFIKQIADFVTTKGKKLFCWNESVTAGGADLELMKQTGATIMSWHPCQAGVNKAISLGLPAIVTEYHGAGGGYYINRRQSNDPGEPSGAGAGDDSVEGCYNYIPVQGSYTAEQLALIKGVQATFWTEHVGTNEYLEYLALPRLICVAEAGWTEQNQKNWSYFRNRLTGHTKWLDEHHYVYGRHWMEGYVPRKESK